MQLVDSFFFFVRCKIGHLKQALSTACVQLTLKFENDCITGYSYLLLLNEGAL
jgi:phosphoglycerate-specific signal transduction histidine kinase